jgi:hypothetical protein
MNKAKRFVFSLSTLILFSGVALAAAPVYAEDGSSGSGSTGSQTETDVENHGHSLAEQFRLQAQEKIAEKKAQVKEQTQEHRQQACEARKTSLTKRMSRAVTQAENHKAVFDKIYTRVQDFYTNKKLSVTDYDSLKAKVDTAQADAAASIQALKDTDISVDCTSSTVADSVSAFQTAVGSTRDSLKTYRAALVDLINSLKGASTGQGQTQDNSNDTNQ